MKMVGEKLSEAGSNLAALMVFFATFHHFFPTFLPNYIRNLWYRVMSYFYPYIQITFYEHHSSSGSRFKRSEAYTAIETYLGSKSTDQAKRLKAEVVKKSKSLVLSMDDSEVVYDEFNGEKIKWFSGKSISNKKSISFYPSNDDKRYYLLTFHRKNRKMITGQYLKFVLEEGKEIGARNRQRKLYSNNPSENWWDYKSSMWSDIVFEHPATFKTLAMDSKKKEEIINDLITFSKAKEYYAKIGKAWKRGYLLYGPPGTGKSTMIAAMANLMNYDVYDLELTAVKDNTELRKLLIETSGKSIIVIEDIDCSLDLTGQRKKKTEKDEEKAVKDPIHKKLNEEGKNEGSKVTLSGLLNCIDGIWSTCGGERIIVFTTNYVEKLDPALIRRGRMDKHIELSSCCFEAFKVLAKNYLDLQEHVLFATIRGLLEETNMTPADVAENLMPKSISEDAETCLKNLIQALEAAKEEARLTSGEEAKMKAEKEEKEKETSGKEEERNGSAKEVKENGVIT